MHVTERWARKLLARMRKEGDRAVVHGLRGRNSNRNLPEAVRERSVKLVKEEYSDFGPTLGSMLKVVSARESLRMRSEKAEAATAARTEARFLIWCESPKPNVGNPGISGPRRIACSQNTIRF